MTGNIKKIIIAAMIVLTLAGAILTAAFLFREHILETIRADKPEEACSNAGGYYGKNLKVREMLFASLACGGKFYYAKGEDEVETPEVILVCSHDYEAVVTEPTCTEAGFTTHTCKICNDSYVDTEITPLGHAFGEWQETLAPTCTSDGEMERYCSRCGENETEAVPALGHDFRETVVSPACTTDGYTLHSCVRCEKSYTDTSVPALGHDWDSGVVTTEPTATADGEKTYTCTRCGQTRTEPIPATGPTHVPGDINGDGVVDSKDLTRFLKYVSGMDVYVDLEACDINGDGVVNSKDLTRLLKYVSGMDVEIF